MREKQEQQASNCIISKTLQHGVRGGTYDTQGQEKKDVERRFCAEEQKQGNDYKQCTEITNVFYICIIHLCKYGLIIYVCVVLCVKHCL